MRASLLPPSRRIKGAAALLPATRAGARALASCLLAAVLAAGAAPAGRAAAAEAADTLTVTNTNDSGPGSLRQAIADAAPGDTVNFNLPPGSVIRLSGGELVINKNLNIAGPGADALTLSALGNSMRIFRVTSGVTAGISGLTVHGGHTSTFASPAVGGGGGVYNAGTLSLTGCVVAGNRSVGGVVTASGLAFAGGGIDNAGTLTLTNTTVTGNEAQGTVTTPDFKGDGLGGGVHNNAGATLVLANSTVTGNLAAGGGVSSPGMVGVSAGGGIHNSGVLVLTNSTVSGNRAESGGGVRNLGSMMADGCSVVNNSAGMGFDNLNPAPAFGGGIDNRPPGTLTLTNCTVSGNRSVGGGANANGTPAKGSGGGLSNFSTAAVRNSTISANVARGGPVANNNVGGSASSGDADGGGVYSAGDLTLVNSTVSGNEAQGGVGKLAGGSPGGKASGGGILAEGALTLTNTTVTLNAAAGGRGQTSAAEGGGIVFRGAGAARPLNTIVAGNSVRGNSSVGGAANTLAAPDVSGTFDSRGHNLVGRNEGAQASFPAGMPNAFGDLVGTSAAPLDARLGPLADNGGPTRTHRPWPGSPAVEGGDNAVLGPPHNLTTDQRGAGFPRLFNARVDIGAVEARDPAATFDLTAVTDVSEVVGSFIIGVSRTGALDAGDLTVDISVTGVTASPRSDFKLAFATLRFAEGEQEKSFTVFVTDDNYDEPTETVAISLSNPTGGAALGPNAAATLVVHDNDVAGQQGNPADNTRFFVRQHYVDFLNREPDPPGLDFWTNEVEQCGADAQCREVRRIHVSAAFFLSIEFQETGFFALRARRAAFGHRSATAAVRVPLEDFLRDAQRLGEGVVVGEAGWPQRLEQNKLDYLAALVETPAFRAGYPEALTPAGFVDALFLSAGVTPTAAERGAAVNAYGWGGTAGRAAALRSVAESASVTRAEFNPAFVLSEYFGYLRRDPTDPPDSDDSGYQFWLAKLNSFGGDFVRAEMVKAFISSAEYRQRFGPQ